MKKKLLSVLGVSTVLFALVACGGSGAESATSQDPSSQEPSSSEPAKTTFTVAFEVEGTRYRTERVKDGEKITATISNPTKEGYDFAGWYEGTNLIDLSTYVVTKSVTLTAHFEEHHEGEVLSVDDVKEAGKTYYIVLGWWETTAVDPDTGAPKITSSMTRDTTRLFYKNLRKYYQAVGASEEEIANIQFRNYSSGKVAEMGAAVLADEDVSILVGVGNNVNTDAGLSLYNSSNEYKFATNMGSGPKSRYVACLSSTNEVGLDTYAWLKTDTGSASFLRELSDEEIEASLLPEAIDLTVNVHGDTVETTHLQDEETEVTLPAITVPVGSLFKGFATASEGEVALEVAIDAKLKYQDLKDLAAGEASLDLYPVFAEIPVVEDDLVVAVQINGSNLTENEAKLLELRFQAAHPESNIRFDLIEGNAATYTDALTDDVDVCVGGNNPVNNLPKYEADTYPTANAGAYHFASTNRKVIIRSTVNPAHVELAVAFYNFITAEAPMFEIYSAVWAKGGAWVTEDEKENLKTAIGAHVETLLPLVEEETLKSKYNVEVNFVDVTTDGNKVADLGAATNALRDGKGADMIIGCGANVDTTGGITITAKKTIDTDYVAAGRYVAITIDNYFVTSIYNTCFNVPANAE